MRKKGWIIFGAIFLISLIMVITLVVFYENQKKAPAYDTSSGNIIVNIETGMNTTDIFSVLKQNNVIRSEIVARIYTKLHEINSLKAGKYEFTGKETLPEVLDKIISGQVMDETITIKFLEGKNMRYIASTIAENTNNTANDVYNLLKNEEYIDSLIDEYWFLTEDIKNTSIYYPLEGYIYPDTYTFENVDVSVETIFRKMLEKMGEVLNKYKREIEQSEYSIHDFLTVSSIIELEGNNEENRSKIARVIYNRLASNMSIGSDVTTYYGIRVDMGERDLYAKELNTYNAYNTRGPNMEGKLPVGPISSPSEESIRAALLPAEGDYLYFIADKNGDIYFTNTVEEHNQMKSELQKKGLWYEYDD